MDGRQDPVDRPMSGGGMDLPAQLVDQQHGSTERSPQCVPDLLGVADGIIQERTDGPGPGEAGRTGHAPGENLLVEGIQ